MVLDDFSNETNRQLQEKKEKDTKELEDLRNSADACQNLIQENQELKKKLNLEYEKNKQLTQETLKISAENENLKSITDKYKIQEEEIAFLYKEIINDAIINKFAKGIMNIAAISIDIGIPTSASIPYSILNGYKNLISLAYGGNYHFKQAANLLNILNTPVKSSVNYAREGESCDYDLGNLFSGDNFD